MCMTTPSAQDRLTAMGATIKALNRLDEMGGLIIEDELGWKFRLTELLAVGAKTDDPGLVLRIAHLDRLTSGYVNEAGL